MADFGTQRLNMVESQVRPSDVTDRHLMSVLQALPRERFLPTWAQALAYADSDVAVTHAAGGRPARYLMAPRTLARLIQAAEINATDTVLDVGCATGYSTAVLAGLAAKVVGLEEDAALVASAREALNGLKVMTATVEQGPLTQGWSGSAPYDVILLNGSVAEVPPALLAQLRDGGRLVAIVVGGSGSAGIGAGAEGFGVARVYVKRGTAMAMRVAFDAGAPKLPGCEIAARFVF